LSWYTWNGAVVGKFIRAVITIIVSIADEVRVGAFSVRAYKIIHSPQSWYTWNGAVVSKFIRAVITIIVPITDEI